MELDIRSLLKDEHIETVTRTLEKFVYKNPTKLNLCVPQEIPVEFARLNKASIGHVAVKWQSGSMIGFDAELSAEITLGPWYNDDGALKPYYARKYGQKFVISCSGTLTPDQTLGEIRVRAIRVKVEKRYGENNLWGIIANAYQDAVKTALRAYIADHPQGLQLPTPPWVRQVESASLWGLDITSIGSLTDMPGMDIGFEIIAAAEIKVGERDEQGVLHKSQYQQFFTLECRCNIEGALHDFSVDAISIKAVERSEGNPMRALVPFIAERQLELESLRLLKEFGFAECIYSPKAVEPALLAQRMGLTIQYRRLSKEKSVFGAVFMEDGEASFYRPDGAAMEPETVQAGTILVDEEASQKRPAGSVNNTVVHECVHWHRHRKAFCLAKLITGKQSISCLVSGGIEGDIAKSLLGMEWQATALAPRIQMPYPAFRRETRRLIQAQREISPHKPLIDLLPSVIQQLAERFQVSKQAAKIRLLETKCPEARGVLEYVDGRYVRPYAFTPGALENHQTFTVSAVELAQVYDESEQLRALLQSGEYTVVESHVCRNDPCYVFGLGGDMPMLTEYARLHVDECCLKFMLTAPQDNGPFLWDKVLCREEKSAELTLTIPLFQKSTYDPPKKRPYTKYNEKEEDEKKEKYEDLVKQENTYYEMNIQPHIEDIVFTIQLIDEQVSKMATFPSALKYLMKEKHITSENLCRMTGIAVSTIESYRGGSRAPRVNNVVDICIALHLPYKVSRKLVELAGYSFSTSFDTKFYDFILCNYYMYTVEFCRKMFQELQSNAKNI